MEAVWNARHCRQLFFMKKIEFFTAKNNSLSCRINGIHLHSAYNPEKEAEKAVECTVFSFKPKYILIPEPSLGYAVPFLKEKFPDAKICAVRFTNEFEKFNAVYDRTFNFFDKTDSDRLENSMNSYFGENGLLHCSFFSWEPSARIFPEKTAALFSILKKLINTSQSVLNTNAYFSKRWIKNTVIFLRNVSQLAGINRGNKDILITASGTSLKNSIPEIKKIRDRVFLIAVSSSLKPLLWNKIIPDLVISTDGGYWAKAHLSALLEAKTAGKIPLAISSESSCQKKLLKTRLLIPLLYTDGISSRLLNELNVSGIKAERNGTVSGTAALLAMTLTDGKVYFCGLDLAPGKGFQHTAPNELEIKNSCLDKKTRNTETRLTASRLSSSSLKIYENWFTANSLRFKDKLFRLSDNFSYANSLGSIKDINFDEIIFSEEHKTSQEITVSRQKKLSKSEIMDAVKKLSLSEEFKKECFPIEYLSYERETSSEKKIETYKDIQKKTEDFVNQIEGLL